MIENDKRFLRIVILFSLGTLAVAVIAGLIAFVLTIEKSEDTMVPDVEGMELANAIIELQDKGLYASVQLRYSNKLSDKGTVLGQEPIPGSVLKADSEVQLRVSRGAAIEKLDNFVGWDIGELEAHIRSLESIYGPLLQLKRPYIRVFDESPSGTILEQKPEPGTELSVLTELELVVSKGPEGQVTEVEDYVGMDWRSALSEVISSDSPFVFTLTSQEDGDPGTVVSQNPSAESEVPKDTIRQLMLKKPEDIEEDYRFGILERQLPDQPVSIPVTIEAVTPEGDKETIASFSHEGGLLTIPYLQEVGSTLIVLVDEEEKIRLEVQEEEN
ncbi:MAG: PASTA domain-containing protein [Spirochaetaceae bacterium]